MGPGQGRQGRRRARRRRGCATSWATSSRPAGWSGSRRRRSCRRPRRGCSPSSATPTRMRPDGNGGPPILDELGWGAHAAEPGRVSDPEPLFPRLDVETEARLILADGRGVRPTSLGRLPDASGPTMPGCVSSTATATSTLTGSRSTSTSSSAAPDSPASSGSSSRAGTSRRRTGRSTASIGSTGSTPRSASIRTTRPRSTATAGRGSSPGRPTRGSWRSARPGLDYDRVFSPIPEQLTNLRRNLALALDTGKPAILHCRSRDGRRDAQDALLGELRDAGVGGPSWAAAFGDRPAAIIHSFSGPLDYARAVIDLGLAVSFSGLVFRRGEEASGEVAAIVPGVAAAGRDRFAVPVAAGRAALAKRTGVGARHSGMGRRAPSTAARWARLDARSRPTTTRSRVPGRTA